jgi:hypothetical protein
MTNDNDLPHNILSCPIQKEMEIFFTLMDYRNNLFTSNDPIDLYRFYNSFEDKESLIEWMKE